MAAHTSMLLQSEAIRDEHSHGKICAQASLESSSRQHAFSAGMMAHFAAIAPWSCNVLASIVIGMYIPVMSGTLYCHTLAHKHIEVFRRQAGTQPMTAWRLCTVYLAVSSLLPLPSIEAIEGCLEVVPDRLACNTACCLCMSCSRNPGPD